MLTIKSKITVYWTTNPAEMGYGTPTGEWKKGAGESMSMKEAIGFPAKLAKKLGNATFAVSYQHDGKEIERSEIAEVVANDRKSKKL